MHRCAILRLRLGKGRLLGLRPSVQTDAEAEGRCQPSEARRGPTSKLEWCTSEDFLQLRESRRTGEQPRKDTGRGIAPLIVYRLPCDSALVPLCSVTRGLAQESHRTCNPRNKPDLLCHVSLAQGICNNRGHRSGPVQGRLIPPRRGATGQDQALWEVVSCHFVCCPGLAYPSVVRPGHFRSGHVRS